MTITLIGQTASGKTTLGRGLEEKLAGYTYKDLDKEVERYYSEQMGFDEPTPISEMYKNNTEEELKRYFRETYAELLDTPNTIIATGGFFAIYFDFEDIENIFYVNISKEIFTERIVEARKNAHLPENANRRIIHYKHISEVHEQYDSRATVYAEKCTHCFDVNTKEDMKNLKKKVSKTILKAVNQDRDNEKVSSSRKTPQQ